MADITLSSAVRANLNSLQSTAELLSDVQNKLATGKKVNSALDNPSNFFTASGLTSRANDLGTLLDDMANGPDPEGSSTPGIASITTLGSAKAIASRLCAQSQYSASSLPPVNELLTQIIIAKDSSTGQEPACRYRQRPHHDLQRRFHVQLNISAVDYRLPLSTCLNLSAGGRRGSSTSLQLRGRRRPST
ncbi:hypothetical protein [Roseibium album]|uniref:flagellin N-terminal helical domain-containing protein n=1 Tax=Roseibium album TaxID=311410 RepID=UPI0039198350